MSMIRLCQLLRVEVIGMRPLLYLRFNEALSFPLLLSSYDFFKCHLCITTQRREGVLVRGQNLPYIEFMYGIRQAVGIGSLQTSIFILNIILLPYNLFLLFFFARESTYSI